MRPLSTASSRKPSFIGPSLLLCARSGSALRAVLSRAVLLAVFWSSTAFAESGSSGAQSATSAPDSTESAPPASATAKDRTATSSEADPYAEAKERVGRAEQLYADGNFDAALTEFERAFETMVGHPARPYVLYNVGRCQEKLYRYDAAIASYREYLEIAGADAEDRGTVEAKIELLEGLLGTLRLEVTGKKGASLGSYEVWVDGRLVGENVEQFLLPGGNHEVQVRAEGFETDIEQVQLPARSERTLRFELSPLAKEYRGLERTYFWTVTGLAAATAATSATFGALTLSKRGDINRLPSEAVTQDDVDTLVRHALFADIFLVSTGVLATSAAVLGFVTDWSREGTLPPEKESSIRVKRMGLAPVQGGGFLSLGGSFR